MLRRLNTISHPHRFRLAGLACFVLAAPPTAAQLSTKTARAMRVTGAAPRIDGQLDEQAWKAGEAIEDFGQQRPLEGAAPTERTQVWVLYDESALYIGARLYRHDPSRISQIMARRDQGANAERLAITFDTQRDRRTGFGFAVSAAGVKSDFRHTQDDEHRGRESQYDPVWEARAVVDSLGWTAEMRIPFSQLRFPNRETQDWGLQLDRWMPDKEEDVRWVVIPTREAGYISRFGALQGINGIHATRPVELLPYVAGDARRRAGASANPFNDPYDWRVGLDTKFGVGSNLTMDATVNPDFGQVEADPAEVNLTAFETIFEERRTFFTEGSELLRAQGPNYFYSRRIGAPPHLAATGDYVDAPNATTILGATKLTGRPTNRLSLGSLLAVTGGERARTFTTVGAATSSVAVEPRTLFGVLRLQQEVGSQASTIGGSLTTMRRSMGGGDAFRTSLSRQAYAGGLDWRLRMKEGRYAVTGWAGFSYVAGDSQAIDSLQRSSAHFFQRPDADYLHYDPSRRSMRGYTASLRADKDAGKHVLWGAQVIAESPGYEINDVGRVQSSDDIDYNADIQIRETMPGKHLRNWRLGFDTKGAYNYAGDHQMNTWTQNTTITFLNFWSFMVRSGVELRAIDDVLTRGGPLMRKELAYGQEWRVNNSFASRTGWRVSTGWRHDELGGHRFVAGGGLTLRPKPRWQLSLEPNYLQSLEPRQYVTTLSGGSAATNGGRYIFAFTDRTTISARMRLNYTFTPALTLEGYAEPFVASGKYDRPGELKAARTSELRTYGTDGSTAVLNADGSRTITDGADSFTLANRDFNVRSFRSNFVLRWEWNPGSTLFVVWQQNRRATTTLGNRIGVQDLFETTRAAGDNFLSVKISYWLPVSWSR